MATKSEETHARFNTALMIHKVNPNDMGSDLLLAVAILLGAGMPSAAAAVVVLAREKFPESFTSFIGD